MTQNNGQSKKPHCFDCDKEIWFSKQKLSPGGKQIPLNLGTMEGHTCDPNDIMAFQQKQLTETNGATQPTIKAALAVAVKPQPQPDRIEKTMSAAAVGIEAEKQEQQDRKLLNMHSTAHLKIIKGTNPDRVEELYDEFMFSIRQQGANVKGTPSFTTLLNLDGLVQYTIYVYYDLPKREGEAVKQ